MLLNLKKGKTTMRKELLFIPLILLTACASDVFVISAYNNTYENLTVIGVSGGVAYFNSSNGIVSITDFLFNETTKELYVNGSLVCTVANGVCNASGTDLNNYTTGISFTRSGNVVTLDLSRTGMSNLSASFTDNTSGSTNTFGYGLNVSGGLVTVANLTACNPATEYSVWDGTQWQCDNDGGGTDTNNYTTNISFVGRVLNLARDGMVNLTASLIDDSILLNWFNITGRPTDLANFTNTPGYITSAPNINVTNFREANSTTAQLNLSDGRVLNATLSFGTGTGNGNITGSGTVAGEGVYAYNATDLRTNKILYVEPNNGSDIQTKINQCPSTGCTVIIPTGTYNTSPISFNKNNVRIESIEGAQIILQSGSNTSLITIYGYNNSIIGGIWDGNGDNNNLTDDAVILFNGGGLSSVSEIKGIIQDTAGNEDGDIIRLEFNNTNNLITNNVLEGGRNAVRSYDSSIITNNRMYGQSHTGVFIRTGSGNLVANNNIYNGATGIGVEGESITDTSNNNVVSNNRFYNLSFSALSLLNAVQNNFNGNSVERIGYYCIYNQNASNNIFVSTNCEDASRSTSAINTSIYLYQSSNNSINNYYLVDEFNTLTTVVYFEDTLSLGNTFNEIRYPSTETITANYSLYAQTVNNYKIINPSNSYRYSFEATTDGNLNISNGKDGSWTLNEILSSLNFFSHDVSGTGAATSASIKAYANDTFGTRFGLSFYTRDNTASSSERMRIDSQGKVGINTTSPTSTLDILGNSSFSGNVATYAGLFSNGSQVCTAANGLCAGVGGGNASSVNGTAGLPAVWSSATNLVAQLISNFMIGNKAVNSSQLNTSNSGSSGQYLMLNSTGGLDWNTVTSSGGSGNITGNLTSGNIPYASNSTHLENSWLSRNSTATIVHSDFIVNDVSRDELNMNYFPTYSTEFCSGNTVNNANYDGFNTVLISSGLFSAVTTVNQSHPCIIGAGDSTTAGGGIMIRNSEYIINGTENATLIWKQINGQDQYIKTKFGFFDGITLASEDRDGCMFMMQTGNHSGQHNQLKGVCYNNNVNYNTTNNYTYTNGTWYILNMYVNAANNNVTFKVYNETGSLLWNNSLGAAGIPSTRETGFGFFTAQNNSDASTTYNNLDYMSFSLKKTIRNVVFNG